VGAAPSTATVTVAQLASLIPWHLAVPPLECNGQTPNTVRVKSVSDRLDPNRSTPTLGHEGEQSVNTSRL
jgi:hypothetical protein